LRTEIDLLIALHRWDEGVNGKQQTQNYLKQLLNLQFNDVQQVVLGRLLL
jgi:hypothetical protein